METSPQSRERGLKVSAHDEQTQNEREIKDLLNKVGELVLELDFRKTLQALTGPAETSF